MPDNSGIGGKNMAAAIMTGMMNGWTKRHQLGQAQGREDELRLEQQKRQDQLIAQQQAQYDTRYARELADSQSQYARDLQAEIDAEGRKNVEWGRRNEIEQTQNAAAAAASGAGKMKPPNYRDVSDRHTNFKDASWTGFNRMWNKMIDPTNPMSEEDAYAVALAEEMIDTISNDDAIRARFQSLGADPGGKHFLAEDIMASFPGVVIGLEPGQRYSMDELSARIGYNSTGNNKIFTGDEKMKLLNATAQLMEHTLRTEAPQETEVDKLKSGGLGLAGGWKKFVTGGLGEKVEGVKQIGGAIKGISEIDIPFVDIPKEYTPQGRIELYGEQLAKLTGKAAELRDKIIGADIPEEERRRLLSNLIYRMGQGKKDAAAIEAGFGKSNGYTALQEIIGNQGR